MKKFRQWFILLVMSVLTIVGTVGWHLHAQAQSSPVSKPTLETAGLTLRELGAGVYGLISSAEFPPTNPNLAICNAGIVIGDDGVLVIDPFQSPALGDLLISTAASLTKQPIRYVLNTHYHFDHTGGNLAAIRQGIPIVGRGPIRQYMVERNQKLDPNPTPPSVVINGKSSIWLGKRQVQIEEVEGHSSGTDLIAYVPDANVLFAGDILFNQRIPYTGDGNLRQWERSLDSVLNTYANPQILPGHGPVTDRAGVTTLRKYFDDLEQLAATWKQRSLSEEQVLKTYAKVPAAYRNYKFQALYTDNLQTAYRQLVQSSGEPK